MKEKKKDDGLLKEHRSKSEGTSNSQNQNNLTNKTNNDSTILYHRIKYISMNP